MQNSESVEWAEEDGWDLSEEWMATLKIQRTTQEIVLLLL